MDTEILYKYQNRKGAPQEVRRGIFDSHPIPAGIKTGNLTLDKSVYKYFKGSYNTAHNDKINKLERRLWNCDLLITGDHRCQAFLNDLIEFSNTKKSGFPLEDKEEIIKLRNSLKNQEILEIIFAMY